MAGGSDARAAGVDAGDESAVLPGHAEVIQQQLFEPLSAADARRLADLLSPVRDHMRAAPPRSAAPRRRR